jgi:hypothetical protein
MWLMYELDTAQKLDKILIWNSNSSSEGFVGWGLKDVSIETSVDGYGYSADDYYAEYAGNGTGAGVGHDIWSPSSPHFDDSIMETSNTMPGRSQAMPFYYSNTSGTSTTERTFVDAQDWTVGGVKTLSIAFNGQVGNTGTLFVVIDQWLYINGDLVAATTWCHHRDEFCQSH